jgi:hypothetical protein
MFLGFPRARDSRPGLTSSRFRRPSTAITDDLLRDAMAVSEQYFHQSQLSAVAIRSRSPSDHADPLSVLSSNPNFTQRASSPIYRVW